MGRASPTEWLCDRLGFYRGHMPASLEIRGNEDLRIPEARQNTPQCQLSLTVVSRDLRKPSTGGLGS